MSILFVLQDQWRGAFPSSKHPRPAGKLSSAHKLMNSRTRVLGEHGLH